MNTGAILARAAAAIGDPSRAAMLWSLLDGESRPASELAMLANISPQTASNHLKLLIDTEFLTVTSMGRNRFFKLSGPSVAAALESLAVVANVAKPVGGIARQSAPELLFARTCYDHLAGELGVALWSRLRARDHVRESGKNVQLSAAGEAFFGGLGIDIPLLNGKRRRFAYACLDWSHRVPHLGGALGAALLDWLLQSKLLVRRRDNRAVRVTDAGAKTLEHMFAVCLTRNGTAIRRDLPVTPKHI